MIATCAYCGAKHHPGEPCQPTEGAFLERCKSVFAYRVVKPHPGLPDARAMVRSAKGRRPARPAEDDNPMRGQYRTLNRLAGALVGFEAQKGEKGLAERVEARANELGAFARTVHGTEADAWVERLAERVCEVILEMDLAEGI